MTYMPDSKNYITYFEYEDKLSGGSIMTHDGTILHTDINLGNKPMPITDNLIATTNVNVNTESTDFIKWLDLINDILSNTHLEKKSQQRYTKLSAPHNNNSSTFPVHVVLNTQDLILGKFSIGNTSANAQVTQDNIAFNLNSDTLKGYGSYQIPQNQLNTTLYYLNIITNANNNNATPKKNLNTKINTTISESINDIAIESIFLANQQKAIADANNESKKVAIPKSHIDIQKIYLNNKQIGELDLKFMGRGANIIVESSIWQNQYSKLEFNAQGYCFSCNKNQTLIDIIFNFKLEDFGKLLTQLGYPNILAQTSGNTSGRIQYDGNIDSFDFKNISAKFKLELKNGRFLKIDTGTLLGSLIGIINLQTITNLVQLKFSDIFANGFSFNELNAEAYISRNIFYLKYLYMSSTLAVVALNGNIDLNNNTVNLYLNVTPSLGIGVAVGAGVITLNPLVGIATYLAQSALQNPVNKLFAFTFHITGDINKPNIEQINASKQITKNISSTIGQ